MLHRRRNKICSILVTSRLVGDAARRAFASTALARRDRRLLELSSEYTGIAFGLRLCVDPLSSRRDRQPSACGGAPQSNHALGAMSPCVRMTIACQVVGTPEQHAAKCYFDCLDALRKEWVRCVETPKE